MSVIQEGIDELAAELTPLLGDKPELHFTFVKDKQTKKQTVKEIAEATEDSGKVTREDGKLVIRWSNLIITHRLLPGV